MSTDETSILELESESGQAVERLGLDVTGPTAGEQDRRMSGRWRRFAPWLGGAVVGGVAALLLASSVIFTAHESPQSQHGAASPAPRAGESVHLSGASPDRVAPSTMAPLTDSQRWEVAKRQESAQLSSSLAYDASAPRNREAKNSAPMASAAPAGSEVSPAEAVTPMILRAAQVTVITQNLDKARAGVDQIVQRYGGYVGELSTSAPSDGPRKLTATLRVPAARLDAAIADLRTLGRIESESQTGQDVTARYVDLEARLSNSRNTEQRLLELLRQRTGKLSDVLEVETELSRVREEIERMEGERRLLSKQVEFSTITATVAEEFKAPAGPQPDSLSTRFRNAAVEGYQSVVSFFVGLALLLISDGPMLLIWVAILFFPARWAWRRLRSRGAMSASVEPAT